jgi:uncharacterized protein YndB with AHSA1/START domain
MIAYTSRVEIARRPRDVYDALLDPALFPDWTEMTDVIFDASPVVGARGTFRLGAGPIKGVLNSEITELVPERRVVYHIDHPWLDWTATSSLTPTADGTSLEYAGIVRLRGWRRILEPLVTREVRDGERREAERLKALLERPVAGAA